MQAPEGREVKCLNQGWCTSILRVMTSSFPWGYMTPRFLSLQGRKDLYTELFLLLNRTPLSQVLRASARDFCYLNKQAPKALVYSRSWLGHCVYFQASGWLHGLLPSLTSTAVGWCPLQPTHARDRQPERRWQALLLAALDIFLEPWSKVGHASLQRLLRCCLQPSFSSSLGPQEL